LQKFEQALVFELNKSFESSINMNYIFTILFLIISFFFTQAQTINNSNFVEKLCLGKEYQHVFEDFKKIELPTEIIFPESQPFISIIFDKKKIDFSNYTPEYKIEFDIQKLDTKNIPKDKKNNTRKIGYLNLSINTSQSNNNIDCGFHVFSNPKNQLYIYETNSKTTFFFLKKNNLKKIKIENSSSIFSIDHDYQFNDETKLKTRIKYFFNHYYENNNTLLLDENQLNKYKTCYYYLFQINTRFLKKTTDFLNYKLDLVYNSFQQKNVFSYKNPYSYNYHVKINFDFNISQNFINKNKIELERNFSHDNTYTSLVVNPCSIYSYEHCKILTGLKMNILNRLIFITPNVQIKWTPIKNYSFYINVNGKLKNSCDYNTLFLETLYPIQQYKLNNSKIHFDVNSNLNFQIFQNVQINFFSEYRSIENKYDLSMNYLYTNTNFLKTGINILYEYKDILSANIKNVFYKKKYDKTIYGKFAWNHPYLISNVVLYYRFSTIPIKFDLNYQHNLWENKFFNKKNETVNSDHYLVFKTTYTHENDFSIFILINDKLVQKHIICYKDFVTQNLNFINLSGGINFKF
jgi:hypothetical protein